MNLEWRLLDLEKKDGVFNTALDLSLLEEIGNGEKPTLVFSTWKPTVSIGNAQNYFLDVDKEACDRNNVDVVRRKSGGQAVFLDDNYFVFSVVANPELFPKDLTYLRKEICSLVIGMLQKFDVPVEFYQPDNIIVKDKNTFRTLGNSGQVITSKAIIVHGSVRYALKNIDLMVDVLKINGEKLNSFENDIKIALTDIVAYNPGLDIKKLKKAFLEKFAEKYNATFTSESLKDEKRILEIGDELKENLAGDRNYKSRGICYLFLNGQNLVPALQKYLPTNTPSTWRESVII